ncbi:ATP-binding protein [Corynebacterium lehmanniae]|uniref:ATP-binding protein n=1 Tax=Corynebacterium haemomassiliense TaxID=2754726 RepID=UPI00370D3253
MKIESSLGIPPSARRLSESLRDVGYSLESAIADLVDNSIMAGASEVDISVVFDGRDSFIRIADNGAGMDSDALNEAMRFGSHREYGEGDLGRYGLGLKTASMSQCRRIEVFSRTATTETEARALDLDFIHATDDWLIYDISDEADGAQPDSFLGTPHGTTVVWKRLDRILPAKSPDGGWARRRIERIPEKLAPYLSMVFHRFLSGEAYRSLSISINGKPLEPWDPFVRNEEDSRELQADVFEIEKQAGSGQVKLRRFLLPTRDQFSSSDAYEQASGLDKWNRQQGLYIYRADRLVQWGGWAGIRTTDEHTKLARASLDFDTDLDETFNINVAKMRVTLPSELRKMIARPLNELCMQADAAYRRSQSRSALETTPPDPIPFSSGDSETGESIGLSLRAAAARTGDFEALTRMMGLIKKEIPELAAFLGFD